MASREHNSTHDRPVGRHVSEVLPGAELLAGSEVVAASCCSSADLVQPGDLYFAVDSASTDAPFQAATAVTRGAAAVVTERMLPLPGATQYYVSNTRVALAEFCHALVGRPSEQAELVGVAGDTAAASITRLTAAMLSNGGKSPAWWDGRWMSEADHLATDVGAEASAPLIASWMSRSVANGGSHFVAGMTPSTVASRAFAASEFTVLCLAEGPRGASLGVSPAAILEHTAALQKQLRSGGAIVANASDSFCCRIIAEASHRVLTYGLDHPADVTGEVLESHTGGQTLMVRFGLESAAIETSVIGADHAKNCLAAVAVGIACGLDLQTIAAGVQSAPRAPGVLEPVVLGQDFNVYLDAANRPERVRDTTDAIQRNTSGRVLTVVLGQSAADNPRLLSVAAGKSDLVIAAGPAVAGIHGRPEFRFVEDSFAAIALGIALAERGDAVLVSGVDIDSEGNCVQADTVRELIALRNAHAPPAWAA